MRRIKRVDIGAVRDLRPVALALAPVAILVLAAVLRLSNLDSASFTYDSARLSNLAAGLVDTGRLPTRGMMSSVGVENPPLAVYLMALPNLVSRNPTISIAFIALINVLAVGALYRLGKRYWGTGVGLLASLLMAVGAWAVFNSRQLQAQDLLIPGTVLFFSFLYAWCIERRPWALAGALVSLTVLTQVHFAALALLPILAFAFLIEVWARLRGRSTGRLWAPLAVGIILSVILYLPYLASDATTGGQNLSGIIKLMQAPRRLHPEVFDLALMSIGGRNIHSLAGAEVYRQYLAELPSLEYWPDRVVEALVVVATVWLVMRLWFQRRQPGSRVRDTLLLLWLLAPLAIFVRSSSDGVLHYFLPSLPAAYLTLAIAVIDLARFLRARLPKLAWPLGGMGVGALTMLVIWQALLTVSINQFIGTKATPGAWGTPIGILAAVAANVDRYADRYEASQVLVLCPGADPRWDECPAVFNYLAGRSRRLAFMDYNDPAIWSHADDDETLVLLAPGASQATKELPQFASLIPEASVPLRERVDEYRFFRIHNPYQDIAQRLTATAALDNAIILVGRGQKPELRRFYNGSQAIFELSEPSQTVETPIIDLARLAAAHSSLSVLSRNSEEVDPADTINRWLQANAYEVEDVWLGAVRYARYLSSRNALPSWQTWQLDADFGGQLRLKSISLSTAQLRAGDPLLIRLNWDPSQTPDKAYAAFVQLWDTQAHVIAQKDVRLAKDDFSPGATQSTQLVEKRIGLTIPAPTKPGEYHLVVGAYDPQTGRRLPVGEADHIAPAVVVRVTGSD